jgi:hypothetical protein
MLNRLSRFVALAGGLMLASGCSGDNPTAPAAPSDLSGASIPLASAIKSDIAASAGNAIATDLESLIANQAAAVGSFAILSVPFTPSRDDQPPASTPPATGQPNCTAASQPGYFLCVKEPGPGDNLKCTWSEEKKLYLCVKREEPAPSNPPPSNPPASGGDQPNPAPQSPRAEECAFNAATLFYGCIKSEEGKSVRKYYQFLDASGKPMEKFIRGTTESIHYLLNTDASEVNDNGSSVNHSRRDLTVSGFLGANRIWNGFGSSADTSVRREELSARKYTGLSVDTLKAVTFVDERAAHPYPLSGAAIRVVDYTVLSTGKQTETTTVHKRVVVTFNGTADVPISLGDYSCILHLDTHKVDGCK